ncbi:hypothetical protein DPK65_02425 [Salmonella enterica subsp. enterica]|nr:hypothetical protein [Salmonella enterica subsp. enterica]ECJ4518299.1 hypothetical protein [Salmonella enterica subsp. enterica]
MTNTKLTDEQLQEIYGEAVSCEVAEKNGAYMASFDLLCKMDDVGGTAYTVRKLIDMLRAERAEPELNPANLVNKFYERYPLASFRDDGFRATALGYFMAGAELQCFGEFVKYEELCGDE